MLVQFSVENFRSFKGTAELSLVPGRVLKHANHIVRPDKDGGISVLRSALIYGANASGKSNLVKAIAAARRHVISGHEFRERIPSYSFRLNAESIDSDTTFSFTIKIEDMFFEYGFSLGAGLVKKEWLNSTTRKQTTNIFRRNENGVFEPMKGVSKQERNYLSVAQEQTPKTALFLSEFKTRNFKSKYKAAEEIEKLIDWFENLTIIYPESFFGHLEYGIQKGVLQDLYSKHLADFDTGVAGLVTEIVTLDRALSGLADASVAEVNKAIENLEPDDFLPIPFGNDERYIITTDSSRNVTTYMVRATHLDNHGEKVSFDLKDESDGTLRLIDIIPSLISSEATYIIDELDRSLHPDLTRDFIQKFLSNHNQTSQLIVTTHDTGLMDLDLVRKDEIWFAKKNRKGESELYSLEEFMGIRRNTDILKAYNEGRYGGKPIIRSTRSSIS